MGLENFDFGLEQEKKETEINDKERKKYDNGSNRLNELKKQEAIQKEEDSKHAERLIQDVNFDIQVGQEVSEGKLNFNLADINGYIDIDNDLLVLNGKEYEIKLPKGADLSSIKLEGDKVIITAKIAFFSGKGEVSLDTFKSQILKLYNGTDKIAVNTENGELVVAKK